jgi:hypothetical protein
VNENTRTGAASILTVPMLSYIAKDTSRCGFDSRPTAYNYTPKAGTNDTITPGKSYCADGIRSDNSLVTGTNPLDTSIVAGPDFVANWINHLTSAQGAGQMYNLDNEPDDWNETHRDVHPDPVSYDELLDRTIAYADAIKLADPTAKILGFSPTGWYSYFYSRGDMIEAEKNGFQSWPDLEDHQDLYIYEYYLQTLRDFEAANGTRLLDYFDVHFYPQNVSADAGNASTKQNRLDAVRSLWDPTYDASDVIGGEPEPEWMQTRLIPRLKEMVAANYPGTMTAISEYNFGGLEDINGALAQADVLGVFGREGLDLATLWNNIYYGKNLSSFATLPGAYAFRMYRNYDGAGGKFGDVSIKSTTSNQAQLAIYTALRSSDGALTVMVINKTASSQTAAVALSGYTPSGAAKVYRYSSANLNAIVHDADQAVTAAGFSTNIPANSISIFVVPGASVPVQTPQLYIPNA